MLVVLVRGISGGRRCCVCTCVLVVDRRSGPRSVSGTVSYPNQSTLLTDLVIGDLAKATDWKLKAPFPSSDTVLGLLMLLADRMLCSEFVSEGERGLSGCAE